MHQELNIGLLLYDIVHHKYYDRTSCDYRKIEITPILSDSFGTQNQYFLNFIRIYESKLFF